MDRVGLIYVDLDDVLSETILALTELLAHHFGRRVAVEDVSHFDLGRSFGLAPEELHAFMQLAHRPRVLASLAARPGAASTLTGWIERGYGVSIVTGRPPSTEAVSRRWLRERGIPHTDFACVDKYTRPEPGAAARSLDEISGLEFSLVVEDSLEVAARLAEGGRAPVALMDRPWNRDTSSLPAALVARIVRCHGWSDVAHRFQAP